MFVFVFLIISFSFVFYIILSGDKSEKQYIDDYFG